MPDDGNEEWRKAKQVLKEVMGNHGPQQINDLLTPEQVVEAESARKEGEGLNGTYSRLSEAQLRVIIDEVLKRQRLTFPNELSPDLKLRLVGIILAFLGGVMQNATWDILKHFIPYLHTLFMSAETTDFMKRSAEAYEDVRRAAPEQLKNFADRRYTGLLAYRARTWRQLQDDIEASELREVMSDLRIKLLLESLEANLFVPVSE